MGYTKNMNLGLAGEYLVAGMIHLEGMKRNELWHASLTLKNYPGIDIFALKYSNLPKGETKQVGIQVKSTYNQATVLIGIKLTRESSKEDVEKMIKCPFVFVKFDKEYHPSYYIVNREEMVNLVLETNKEYFEKAKKDCKPEQPIALKIKDLSDFENKWDPIWE